MNSDRFYHPEPEDEERLAEMKDSPDEGDYE